MAELPSGTVTLLFTDIEGSTAPWERHPAAMRAALARRDRVSRMLGATKPGRGFRQGRGRTAGLPASHSYRRPGW
jgi:hypothetical protein